MEMKSDVKNLALHAQDLPGLDSIWFHGDAEGAADDGLLDVDVSDPSSLFYTDDFPPLPDFGCMSSSSSSSTPPLTAVPAAPASSSSASTASSSAAASWAVLRSDAEQEPSSSTMDLLMGPVAEGVGDEGIDLMENFGSCIDLLETSDICWDPSPLFETDPIQEFGCGAVGGEEEDPEASDLAVVFFEWLKCNKEVISAEDLRNIKIKKSTIEAAAKRLGGGKEGMKQLLKLILEWVQNHHLSSKKKDNENNYNSNNNNHSQLSSWSLPNTSCAPQIPIVIDDDHRNNNNSHPPQPPPHPAPAQSTDWMPMVQPPPPPPPPQYVGDPMGFSPYSEQYNHHPHMMDAAQGATTLPWGPSPMQFGMAPHYVPYTPGYRPAYPPTAAPGGFYYHPGTGEGLVRMGASATKEARKKRMARQRRYLSHHQRHHHHNHNHHHLNNININNNNSNNNQYPHQIAELHPGGGVVAPHPAHGNWVYWPQLAPPPQQVNVMQMQHPMEQPAVCPPSGNGAVQKQAGVDNSNNNKKQPQQQGWKTEKNLKFLLQKVLKQSDVGNLGRIVLPKKEAETHLPELEARDGIPIAMEDIGTSQVWNMRYRFWPNNKSRMYLLENTGDFVRSNGLQEGDFIVIYSDVKCGKYMIRGVKVRQQQQQQGAKPETSNKRTGKTLKSPGSISPVGPSSSPIINQ